MEPINSPIIPEVNPIPSPAPIQLTPQDKRTQQMNTYIQTAGSVLQTILSGISRVVQEIVGLILRR
ncbi:hypothetical protein A2363_01070 [Candidatus Gottesmanbacteria bacterium RIFOXYB1_FULL_47_11]|uniref:Uncharacterized protein n=1 Tax=Candidatus Gottesmanbacteria bacterium RIFOXYB1_FULL_47_11 TaxID=1798401 RepID=A0A1F6BDR8_9BACT|nr:MAG: hypothetical protein A2363_01070 [Candidatus Gottesmanbacteria bacterium RIFOXYB1_FULL_47_11]